MEGAPGRDVVQELDAADLDQPVAVQAIEAGRFGVEDDLAHALLLSCFAAECKRGGRASAGDSQAAEASARRIASTSRSAAVESAAGIDEEMRAAALLRVRHLAGQDGGELRLRHAGPGEHARALHRCVGA